LVTYETTKELATRWHMSERTLEKMRQDGNGPPYIKCCRKVLYDTAAVDAWMAAHTVAHTSDATVRDQVAA